MPSATRPLLSGRVRPPCPSSRSVSSSPGLHRVIRPLTVARVSVRGEGELVVVVGRRSPTGTPVRVPRPGFPEMIQNRSRHRLIGAEIVTRKVPAAGKETAGGNQGEQEGESVSANHKQKAASGYPDAAEKEQLSLELLAFGRDTKGRIGA